MRARAMLAIAAGSLVIASCGGGDSTGVTQPDADTTTSSTTTTIVPATTIASTTTVAEAEPSLSEAIVGAWVTDDDYGIYKVFKDDGTYGAGPTVDAAIDGGSEPGYDFGTWSAEETILAEVPDPRSPCVGLVGTYEIKMLDDDTRMQVTRLSDDCEPRRSIFPGELTTVLPASASIFAPVRGVSAPTTGWIVSESPYAMGIYFWGLPAPDSVTVNGEDFIDADPHWHLQWLSPPLDLASGVNRLHLAVEYRQQIIQEALIPVTYLEGAEERLGSITAATSHTITIDFTEWDDDQEFPGPEDPDPGVLTTLPIADQVRVIVDDEVAVEFAWFAAEVNAGCTNLQGLDGLDDWNPSCGYPYTLTIYNGEVVQIWKVPLG